MDPSTRLGLGGIEISSRGEIAAFVRSGLRLLGDSTRTYDAHVMEEFCLRRNFARLEQLVLSSEDGRALWRDRPEMRPGRLDYAELSRLPEGTLGGAYGRWQQVMGLDANPQFDDASDLRDADVAYLVRRYWQSHDVWHVVLGLGREPYEEVLLHAFCWSQLRLASSSLIVLFGVPKHFVLEGRWRALGSSLRHYLTQGRRASALLPVYWERMWTEPLQIVRRRLGVSPEPWSSRLQAHGG